MAERHELQRHPPLSTYIPEQRMLVTTATDEHETVTTVHRGDSLDMQRGAGPYLVVRTTATGPVPQIVRAAQEQHDQIVLAVREGRADDFHHVHGFGQDDRGGRGG
jgi:hypothetical protein